MRTAKLMRRLPGATLALLSLALLFIACSAPAPVIQGKVLSVSADGGTITLQDDMNPQNQPQAYDIREAEIGAEPAEGDQLRIVYRAEGGANVALRVMNITRQKAREASGH